MASIKVKFRNSSVENKKGSIFYQVIHNRITRQMATDYRVFPHEWNTRESSLTADTNADRFAEASSIAYEIKLDLERFSKIIRKYETKGIPYSADDILSGYKKYMREYSLNSFMTSIIRKLNRTGKVRTAETYISALSSFKKFLADYSIETHRFRTNDIMLDSLTSEIVEAYESHLRCKGIVPNTISFYMRILRAVYNRAVDKGDIEQSKPFRHVYTGIEKTVKRALTIKSIKKIKSLDLSKTPPAEFARDMFLLSFYLRGMSFIDMAFLRKTDLINGYIIYRRRKTGQLLTIAWTKEMQHILDKYPQNSTPYLLPIIKSTSSKERSTYRNMGYKINYNLKTVARLAGVDIRLTMYCARHSWASAAKTKGIPISVISKGMGHNSEVTTQIYLASLDNSVVDRANAKLIRML